MTGGCGNGRFCPDSAVTRDQMALFLLRAKMGTVFDPPPASGAMFSDVPEDHWAASWIEELARHGITGGCSDDAYCPDAIVSRDQMAVFLVRTFDLTEPDFETLVVLLINAEREGHGLLPLVAQPQLVAAARGHSTDMADHDYFSHFGLDGSSVADRLDEQGYRLVDGWREHCRRVSHAGGRRAGLDGQPGSSGQHSRRRATVTSGWASRTIRRVRTVRTGPPYSPVRGEHRAVSIG